MRPLARASIFLCSATLAACREAPAGPTCANECTTLATFDGVAGPITLDATSAYLLTLPAEGRVVSLHRIPQGGGPDAVLTTTPSWGTWRVAVDATSVYWTAVGPDSGVGRLERVALGGGAPETLAADLILPGSVAVDADSVYVSLFDGGIGKVPVAGGTLTKMGPSSSSDLVLRGESVACVSDFFGVSQIERVSVSDGSVVDVAAADDDVVDIALDDTTIYWATHGTSPDANGSVPPPRVSRAPLAGGTETDAATLGNPGGIAVDAEHLYYTDLAARTLTRAALDGTAPEVIAAGWPEIRWLAVDDAHVYFTASTDDGKPALVRMEK